MKRPDIFPIWQEFYFIDGFCKAFAPGETVIWQIPNTKKERVQFYKDKFLELSMLGITGVFAVSDYYALDFMQFLHGRDVQIPKDLQIIGMDDSMASRESIPALTTIHQDADLRAKTAIECIEDMREGRDFGTRVVLPVKLIKRESTRKL